MAAPCRIYIFDLLALASHQAALNSCLDAWLTDPDVIKTGIGLKKDMKVLHASYPELTAAANAQGIIDLK